MPRLASFALIAITLSVLAAPKCTGDEGVHHYPKYDCSCKRTCNGTTETWVTGFQSKDPDIVVTSARQSCERSCRGATCDACACMAASRDADADELDEEPGDEAAAD